MSRQASSGRLPAFGALTKAQCDEIARMCDEERSYAIAIRLGVPKKLVKAEIRRLRAERSAPKIDGGRRAAVLAGLKVVAPLVLGASFLGFAINHRASEAAVSARSEHPQSDAGAVRTMYRSLDQGKVDLDAVLPALESPNEELRLAAIRSYMSYPPKSRDPEPLVQCLNDDVERLRLCSIQGLGLLGDPRAIPPLAAVLASARSAAERGLALDTLGKIPDDSAVPPMIAALTDSLGSIRLRAFRVLTKRLGTSLNCVEAQLEKDPATIREVFKNYWKELAQ